MKNELWSQSRTHENQELWSRSYVYENKSSGVEVVIFTMTQQAAYKINTKHTLDYYKVQKFSSAGYIINVDEIENTMELTILANLKSQILHVYEQGSVYFANNAKSTAGTILPFELYPALSTYNTEFMTPHWQ